ncbi:MAG: RNA polymerase sigma factor [Acidimicrobiales bacterium]
MTTREAKRAVDAIWRIESAKVVATLARFAGDFVLGEDLAQDALVAALEQWPRTGTPEKPGAWLVTVGKRRYVDSLRRRSALEARHDALAREFALQHASLEADGTPFGEEIADGVLRLIFISAHPLLSSDARVALTLRVVAGLHTDEIAHAFLVPEATVAQRIVRAKRTLSEAKVPFTAPAPHELEERLESVLDVIYLVFNEGYVATSGAGWTRPELCHEALRLGRSLAELLREESEVHGLVALMELQASRLSSRVDEGGEAVLLGHQNRSRWDRLLIRRGLASLERGAALGRGLGRFGLQAAIAACHAQAENFDQTNWVRIAALYDALAQIAPSPIVDLNRAVGLSMAYGPDVGLEAVRALESDPFLSDHHLLAAARADLYARLGRRAEARREFARAASLTRNEKERDLMARRAAELDDGDDSRGRY